MSLAAKEKLFPHVVQHNALMNSTRRYTQAVHICTVYNAPVERHINKNLLKPNMFT
jgi:hypothetical protein